MTFLVLKQYQEVPGMTGKLFDAVWMVTTGSVLPYENNTWLLLLKITVADYWKTSPI